MDSMRRPAPVRTPSLAEVPEDGQFAIGDDDEDEDDAVEASEKPAVDTDTARRTSSSTTITSATSPARLSEKARGKQPASALRVSTSRNASTTSLNTLTTPVTTTTSQTFLPSEEWLENWYNRLPLEPILRVIEEAESTSQQHGFTTDPREAKEDYADLPGTATEDQFQHGREARQSAQHPRHHSTDRQEAQGAHGQGHLGAKGKHRATLILFPVDLNTADVLGDR